MIRYRILMAWAPVVFACTSCASLLPMGNDQSPTMSAVGGSLTQAAASSGVFAVMTWAGVALVAAGIVSWMLGNRTRALMMIGAGAFISVGTLIALEIASMLIWPAIVAAIIIGATMLVTWGLPKWRKVAGK